MVIGRTGIVYRPHEIVEPVAIKDIGCLAESIVLQGASLRRHHRNGIFLDGHHIVVQLGTCHVAVAPVKIGFARNRVCKHIHINLLPATDG